jgi:hypothetical protein
VSDSYKEAAMKTQLGRRITGGMLLVSLLSMLLVANVSTARAAEAHASPAPTACAAELTSAEMAGVYGADLVAVIDGACLGVGLGSVFFNVNKFAMAFCAGWAIGRYFS